MASRLAQMQMRFQQKQQQEREQRRLELTNELQPQIATNNNTTHHVTSKVNPSAVTKNIGNGKVRQMFDERRRGIDRSNPLKPIQSAGTQSAHQTVSKTTSTSRLTANAMQQRSPDKRRPAMGVNNAHSRENLLEQHNTHNGNTHRGIEYSEVDNRSVSVKSSSQNLRDSDHLNNNETISKRAATEPLVLNPVITKKSPKTVSSRGSAPFALNKVSSPKSASSDLSAKTLSTTAKKAFPDTPPVAKQSISSARKPTASTNMAAATPAKAPVSQGPPAEGMIGCRFCGRHFNEDRIQKHEQVCQKIATSKRKVFDVTKQRIKGTDLEEFSRRKPNPTRANARPGGGAQAGTQRLGLAASQPTAGGAAKKSNWRQKHEEFIQAIRAAKQVQAHLSRGGKLSDLPPPPPSENPDYIQCPHCLRRFNQTAAERHIPKCATMLHNKPKPGAGNAATKRR